MDNKKRPVLYAELAYLLGLVLISLATALMTVADFGLSMISAPPYLLHLKLAPIAPFFSFGMASYAFQAFLLILMVILIRRFRLSYLFSFITGVLYGLILDGCLFVIGLFPTETLVARVISFAVGVVACSVGVALMFRSYISPCVFELFVKETATHFDIPISRFKTGYDCASLILSLALSFCFFGFFHFEGIHVGTVICAVVNGPLIGCIGKWMDSHFSYADRFPLRKWFEK